MQNPSSKEEENPREGQRLRQVVVTLLRTSCRWTHTDLPHIVIEQNPFARPLHLQTDRRATLFRKARTSSIVMMGYPSIHWLRHKLRTRHPTLRIWHTLWDRNSQELPSKKQAE
jgi:hypothetical protein